MKLLIVNNHTSRISQLLQLFKKYEVDVIDCDNFSSEKADKYDAIILSGGSHVCAANQTKQAYETEMEFIKTTGKPVIGICLGSQLIAKAFGSELTKLTKKAHGIKKIAHKGRKYQVFESHKYVIGKLPSQFQILAQSDYGIEIFKHKEKPLLGFQFHPEAFPRKADGGKLFLRLLTKNRLKFNNR